MYALCYSISVSRTFYSIRKVLLNPEQFIVRQSVLTLMALMMMLNEPLP